MMMNSTRNSTSADQISMGDQALTLWLPKLRHYLSWWRLFTSPLPSRRPHLESLADPPAPADPSDSQERLRQNIEAQVAEIGRLVGGGEAPGEATRHLTELTNQLILAQLGIVSKVKCVTTEATDRLANRAPVEMSGVYEPERLLRLGHLFDKAVSALTPSLRTQCNRTDIAKLILGRTSETKVEFNLFIKFVAAIATAAEEM
ncbi:hypothetical protein [Bradyrhizobium sp. 62B]|uniref:hypothetical protein n=1 Tax=Bradyrhizobium sp. 62B TaxID=2898442 RepID=UPI0025583A5B